MSYNATARRLLISCPGDIPQEDLAIVRRAISRWNAVYGHQFASVIVPISWGSNAAAEFGRHPQEILNEQLVDDCDICVAIFANRLGTETPNAESGTVEEINKLHDAGCYVAILRSARPVDASHLDLDQAGRLREYMTELRDKALVLSYGDDLELQSHVDAILNTAVSRDRARAELQLQATEDGTQTAPKFESVAEVWPRVESEERVKSDSKGRVRMSRYWWLTLANTGNAPARNVTFRTEVIDSDSDEEAWFVHRGNGGEDDDKLIEALAPSGDMRFPIFASMGSAQQVRCTVKWEDDRGEQENVATLRLS